ncbi:hypothetical protein BJ508DRAFT_318201 [Ascobolus immersus RN42]|uniref:cysteine--tRNA ligase n=1 Tax=Ascobolus immersus RN42 TaxID=1160509 RepID=A0A3N4ICR7_ASCIM|nr:hypothetical protein BJ508DRAFT_318201 [Ascobolus immersus RN42]
MSARTQPPWTAPPKHEGVALPPLTLYNSLTRTKTPFIPLDPNGKKITWYCCGPTVYDAGHLGHARNYVTTDIIRRIARDYFGWDVFFVQNVTDVDDKIILRARQQFLFEEYRAANPSINDSVKAFTLEAWKAYVKKNVAAAESTTPSDFVAWVQSNHADLYALIQADEAAKTKTEKDKEEDNQVYLDEKQTKVKMHLRTLLTATSAINSSSTDADAFYAATSSILLPYLDSLPENKTREYSQDIFAKLSTYWENHFNEDMKKLNVLPPTVTTRVSEFIPQNVDFVQKLVEKGLAYPTVDGSVYFDIAEYEKRGHHYAKLEPWNRGNSDLLADGEGALAGNTEAATTETDEAGVLKAKKSPNDFALWKASKQGEPKWPSPWGQGRPGWHIECSVMCSEVLGGRVDIHTGGIDLAFPHHDNELAQSEAYWDDGCCTTSGERHQWINYFLHMGHLSIQGSKMSKSLKNFVSIREALAEGGGWTPRSLRIVFLLGGWKEGVEIGKALITEAKSLEGKLNKFFTNVRAMISEADEKTARNEFVPQPFTSTERDLFAALDKTRAEVHGHLCNSFNTSDTLASLSNLVTTANLYIALPPTTPKSLAPLIEIARWITWLLQVFGLDPNGTKDAIGWTAESADGASSESKEKTLMPYLRALSEFRDEVRDTAMAAMKSPPSDAKALPKQLLGFTDKLRNSTLPPLGVSLDDRDGQAALVKLVDPAVLLAEQREKEEKAAKKAEEKAKRIEAERKAQEEKDKKDSVDPATMFKTDEYEAWDENGLPTKLKGGEELPKSRVKKVEKLYKAQKKAYEGWLARQGKKGDVVA